MQVSAKLSSIRITPRKIGLLADEVRGKGINEALTYLRFSPRKRTAEALYKLIKSAAANADQKGTVDVDTLYVKTILVGQGVTMKRFRPRAKGSAFKINKKTSHISVTLAEK
ncbi:MAG: 50S ribosomal protein L22 [Bdellovibrionales bacterium GWC1_52_8]|nr:MAG: 50S ribosomal protein L22 [Bdellovibrionales bacterium GWB1_52_6]OFZ02605.1 MAG: 50S ribosomal protein L22 [Bdellovibrionales bacterium GWA1_52_35]OFZ41798.1 MAG: 50S ribosomal protein L22 [Bdellovibrionales bacterium GWC1_52_8]HCM41459.1 50S ribosomal protein L22 [Bdellovibrionales bacterium]